MKRQSELVRALRKELAEKEKELANQKWVFEQFLNSHSWRWTAPIRWVAKQLRVLRNGTSAPEFPEHIEHPESAAEPTPELKTAFTDLCLIALGSFLASGKTLDLPESATPEVSVILVLFNRAELTLACLRSVAEHYKEEIEVVIVDNASSDETPRLLESLRGARIFRNEDNRHFLAAANQAARECRGKYLLLLNSDAQLVPDALQKALETLQSSADIGAVGGKIILLDGTLQEAGSVVWRNGSCAGYGRGDDPFAPMYNFRRDVDYCSGAFLMTPRKIWEELGGFDPTFEPAYYEETDYCMRLWQRGLRVVYEPAACVVHYEFASSDSVSDATTLQAQHRATFAARHRLALSSHRLPGPENLLWARSPDPARRVLFFDDRVPHLWLGSGFPRAHAMLRELQRQRSFITFYPLSLIREPWETAYSDFPHEIEIMMGMGRELLETFLRSRRQYYSVIIVSRPHNMELLNPIISAHPDWFENVHLIYDAEALFAAREVGLRKLGGNPMTDEEVRKAFSSEIRLAKTADQVVAVSENEREAFQKNGVDNVEVLGHTFEVVPETASFENRSGLLFVGAVHNDASPNADSLTWFLREVFPSIRQRLGDIPFTIAGVIQSDIIRSLVTPPVRLAGHLPSLEGLYSSSRVFVAPTRFAAGIPHKVHEAAAHGVPVVATPLLATQLGWSERELAVAQDADSFAAQCVEIYTNPTKWNSLREAALERVRRDCSPQAFAESVRRILSKTS